LSRLADSEEFARLDAAHARRMVTFFARRSRTVELLR
jgi:hypothetical protein